MSKASRPIYYTRRSVMNSGPKASELLRELVSLTGFPITSTLQGLGAYPGNDNQFLGMLGMHGTYEIDIVLPLTVWLCPFSPEFLLNGTTVGPSNIASVNVTVLSVTIVPSLKW